MKLNYPESLLKITFPIKTITFRIFEGGEKAMTVRSMCEGIAKLNFKTGGCNFLENVDVQVKICF